MDAGAPLEKQYVYIPPEHRSKPSPQALPKGKDRFLSIIPDIPEFVKQNIKPTFIGFGLAAVVLLAVPSHPSQQFIALGEPVLHPSATEIMRPIEHPALEPVKTPVTAPITSEQAKALSEIQAKIESQAEIFAKQTEVNKKILRWKPLIEAVVAKPYFKIPAEEQPFWVTRLSALIRVENIEANSNTIAKVDSDDYPDSQRGKGLVQMTEETADMISNNNNFNFEYNLFDPEDNLILTLAQQRNLEKIVGKEFAAWGHHIGEGGVKYLIKLYSILEGHEPIDQVEKDINNPLVGPHKFIKKYDLTPELILATPSVSAAASSDGIVFSEDRNRTYLVDAKAAEKVFSTRREASLTQETKG